MSDKNYYIVSFKHCGSQDNSFEFWGFNSSGYTRAIEGAGLYELPINFDEKSEKIDFKKYVHKDIVNKLKQKITLATYGEKQETYAGFNEFHVLPNTGQIRRELGLTILDFNIQGNRDSFKAYFENTCHEVFKYEYSKTHFNVKGKEKYFDEWWYCNSNVQAENRNKAIYEIYKNGDFGKSSYDCSFIEFKEMVTCSRVKTKVLDKWSVIKK